MGVTLSIEENSSKMPATIGPFRATYSTECCNCMMIFVRYIIANVKEDDTLGFDVLEIISMDELPIASDKLLKISVLFSKINQKIWISL